VARGACDVDGVQLAYIETLMALAAWRAAQDAEAVIAHWCVEGLASHNDLVVARDRTTRCKRAHAAARRQYQRLTAPSRVGVRPVGR
jgi:hypothetical protein